MATPRIPSWYLPGTPADILFQDMAANDPNVPRPLALGGRSANLPAGAFTGAPGTLPGAPGIGGSSAAGQIPQVPDPTRTGAAALAGNLANLAKLRQLFTGTSRIAGIGPGMTQAETANINDLLNPPSQFVDIDRMSAEAGTATGLAGSPAAETRGYRMTDEEMLRRRLLGSNLLSQRATRANTILPLQSFMQTPQEAQLWQNFSNTLRAGADPEQAFQRALQLAREGVRSGYQAGYGGGAGGARGAGVPAPTGGYAGDVNWNALTQQRLNQVPTWPVLPGTGGGSGGPSSVYAPPPTNFNEAEDWLSSLGLGMNQPGVSISPTNSFQGDISAGEDWYG